MNSAVIFSIPEIGMAGLTESNALRAGYDVGVVCYDLAVDARAQVDGHTDGLLKLVYDRGTHRLLGVHALGEGVASIMGEAALAVSAGLSTETLASAVHPHPTLSESFGRGHISCRRSDRPHKRVARQIPGADLNAAVVLRVARVAASTGSQGSALALADFPEPRGPRPRPVPGLRAGWPRFRERSSPPSGLNARATGPRH